MPDAPNERATLLISVPSATVAFTLAFNVGAFGEIFFDVILSVWVVATVVLIASVMTPRLPPQYWGGRIILLLPSAWLFLAYLDDPFRDDVVDKVIFPASVAVTLVVLPFILWVLVSAINPDFIELPTRSKLIVGAAVVTFALAGFGIGERNDLFLYCDDFKVSGNDLPSNCIENTPSSAGLPTVVGGTK